ncbi:MAG: VanZ family protein [Bacteroidia bacterium]|nr:VanZ family protein [Bacteroidia bacterium]
MIRKNIFSIIVALVIVYLSLTSSERIDKLPLIKFSGFDKIVHCIMYFVLMSVLIYENRKSVARIPGIFLLGLIPFFFGLILELLQSWITTTRTGSIYDLLFNLAGILFAIVFFLLARRFGKENFRY